MPDGTEMETAIYGRSKTKSVKISKLTGLTTDQLYGNKYLAD